MFERTHKFWLNGARKIANKKDDPEIDSSTIFLEHFILEEYNYGWYRQNLFKEL